MHFQPRLLPSKVVQNGPPPYPRHISTFNHLGMNQLPHKLAPTGNVVLRRNTQNYTKGSNNKQRHSLPPPPSYTSHLASVNIEQRKEIALSGHDWTRRTSDIFTDPDLPNSRPTSEYDSDCWRSPGKLKGTYYPYFIYSRFIHVWKKYFCKKWINNWALTRKIIIFRCWTP